MALAIANALDDGLDFHITPDGQGRKTHKVVTVTEFPSDPETKQELSEFHVKPTELGLPYVEDAEIEIEGSGVGAEFDTDTAAVRVWRTEDEPLEARVLITAYGPPEFTQEQP